MCEKKPYLTGHVGELGADDRVVDEALAEGLALEGVLHGLLDADAGEAHALDDDAPALVVEVVHDALKALVLDADNVLHGNLDVLKRHVGCAAGPHTAALHLLALDARGRAVHEQERDAAHAGAAGANGHCKVVGEDAVGDPLLLAVDGVELAAGRLDGRGADARHVGASVGLCDGEADDLLAAQAFASDAVAQRLAREVEERRHADLEALHDAPDDAAGAGARELVEQDELVEDVELGRGHAADDLVADVLGGPGGADNAREPARLGAFLVDALGQLAVLVPLVHVGHQLRVHERAHSRAEAAVRVIVVGRVPALVPGRVAVGHEVAEGARLGVLSGDGGTRRLALGDGASDRADDQARVLGQHVLAVQTEERLCDILARQARDHTRATGAARPREKEQKRNGSKVEMS